MSLPVIGLKRLLNKELLVQNIILAFFISEGEG